MIVTIMVGVLVFVNIFFLIAILRKNFAVIDIGWGLGFILISLIAYMYHPNSFRNAFLLMLVTIWGLRLAIYIFGRSRGKPEDHRYAKFRQEWQPHPNLHAWLKVFIFQGLLMVIVTLPVTVSMAQEAQAMSWLNYLGLKIWFIGFILEVYSDHYLNRWKSKPENKGKICTTGPWRLCRFPNYFGEVIIWYGVYLIAFDLNSAWTIIGPITINLLILKVTGIPLLEKYYEDRADYQEYAKRVPRFIPFIKPSK
jgi:steroid 5-alpha reductase family enzyme